MPVAFYEVVVSETLKGRSGDTVVIGGVDGGRIISKQVSPLVAGEKVVLFLSKRTTSLHSPGVRLDDPDMTLPESYYMRLGLDNGVFDVLNDERVQPRKTGYFEAGDLPSDLDDVRTRVAGS